MILRSFCLAPERSDDDMFSPDAPLIDESEDAEEGDAETGASSGQEGSASEGVDEEGEDADKDKDKDKDKDNDEVEIEVEVDGDSGPESIEPPPIAKGTFPFSIFHRHSAFIARLFDNTFACNNDLHFL
jgi:hypothetical protein